ncbi:ribosomal L28 family-domain-containing protein [Pelagophyceae sp. CCMP2097]|nr:ribosomal L28 family-domain-containing protein [Pelagophyceae sp. CCMP2097]|mmetsp:Transcript_19531/g.66007  ORF Transcript_19531/g.66007 Transcript_19531/m.66007 type:complete len:118 (-) Transcript_19531:42-395(-)
MLGRIVFLAALAATAALVPQKALVQQQARVAKTSDVSMKFRICDLTGKRRNAKAMTVTFSHVRNHKVQQVNLQDRRLWWVEGNRFVKMRISTKALKTIAKYGLNSAAKKYDVDLNSF